MNASEIFDEALQKTFADKKSMFLKIYGNYFSNETEESLRQKTLIVRERMAEGRDFNEICDDPDVYLGSTDKEYVSYLLDSQTPISLETWRKNDLYGWAIRLIE